MSYLFPQNRDGATLDTVFDQAHEIVDVDGKMTEQAAVVHDRIPGIAAPADDDGGPLAWMIRRGCYLALDPSCGVPSVELREGADSAWYGAGGSATNPTRAQRRVIVTAAGTGLVKMRKPLLLPPTARYRRGCTSAEAKYLIGGIDSTAEPNEVGDWMAYRVILQASKTPIKFNRAGQYLITTTKDIALAHADPDPGSLSVCTPLLLMPRQFSRATSLVVLGGFVAAPSAMSKVWIYHRAANKAGVVTGPSGQTFIAPTDGQLAGSAATAYPLGGTFAQFRFAVDPTTTVDGMIPSGTELRVDI